MRRRRVIRAVAAVVPTVAATIAIGLPATGASTPAAQRTAPAATPAPPPPQAPLTADQAQQLSTNVTDKVIVVMKNQLSATPETGNPTAQIQRAQAAESTQAPITGELAQTHAQNVAGISVINALSATVSPGEAQRLQANPDVAEVVPDEPIPVTNSAGSLGVQLPQKAPGGSADTAASLASKACAPNGQVQLDPQAVTDVHAAGPNSAQSLGYTGSGVKVGFIADGLDTQNQDFIRPNGQPVFTDYQDFSNTGTASQQFGGEAFLDSSSIAAQGTHTYDLQSLFGVSQPCNIRVLGVAPGASLVGLNVFGASATAYNSVFLEAINYAVNVDHVNVLNESFGSNPFPDEASLDLTKQADDAAVAAGVTVTASTGDAGSTNTIGSPATDLNVISAGASTTFRSYAQLGQAGITYPGVKGWLNDNISGLSSGGVDQAGRVGDILAPGDLNWALCSTSPQYSECSGEPLELSGGTSEAAPLTAGVAALVDQAYAEAHNGANPTPAQVKQIITSSATDVSSPSDQQGGGLLNAYGAVQAAKSFTGTTAKPAGSVVLKSASQLDAAGQPGATQKLTDTLTNDGASTAKLTVGSRTLGAYKSVGDGTVNLQDATGNNGSVTFQVPAGQARLNTAITYKPPTSSSAYGPGTVTVSLIDPNGNFAATSIPQGVGGYGDAQVANPVPGTWTAVIFSSPSAQGGTTGPVKVQASTAGWAKFGSVGTKSLTLAPGASAPVTLSVPAPKTPGDQAGAIVVTNAAGGLAFNKTTTIPVALRSYVPTPSPTSSFTGTLTGGNGRASNTGESLFYQVSVPAGTKALNAQVGTPNAANSFYAELIDPTTGQAAATASNALQGASSSGQPVLTPETGTQLHVLNPNAGTWTLAINFYNEVSGTAISQPVNVSLNTTPAKVTVAGLPNSAKTALAAGQPATANVTVTNTGAYPEEYFTDARLPTPAPVNLAAQNTNQVQVPIGTNTVPLYLVPTHTTSITASATASAPIFFDYFWQFGDPDLISNDTPYDSSPTGTFDSPQVAPGDWGITPFQQGADGPNGDTPVTATTSMNATTLPFDPAVSSPTGDLWADSVNPAAGSTPYVVQPGQSVTIPVTITPTGATGSTVTGTLYLDSFAPVNGIAGSDEFDQPMPEGADIAAFPYSYTVK